MTHILILGGTGRIGRAIAADLLAHTNATLTLTGRAIASGELVAKTLGPRTQFLPLNLSEVNRLEAAIATADLVIHTAGPFHDRDTQVLELCISYGIHYLDVSDHRSFTEKVRVYKQKAAIAGITAITNTGIFPGLSNAMVRRDTEILDTVERVHLSYVVAGSGGAGPTVMRTTFLGLQHPFKVWINGCWQMVQPYSDREMITFPAPYGAVNVFWFDMPETLTLVENLPIQTLITKFGSVPEIYNVLTGAIARYFPQSWLQNRAMIEFLSWASYTCTQVSDRFSGIGVAIRSEAIGVKDGKPMRVCSTLVAADTAIAAGQGTGGVAQLILTGELQKPGVWTVEESLPTSLFQYILATRSIDNRQIVD